YISSFCASQLTSPSPRFPYTTLFRSNASPGPPRPPRSISPTCLSGPTSRHIPPSRTRPTCQAAPRAHLAQGYALRTPWDRHILSDRKSTRLNSSHVKISYADLSLKKK